MKLSDVSTKVNNGDRANKAYEMLKQARRDAPRPTTTDIDEQAPAPGSRKVRVPELVGLPARSAIVTVTQAGLRPVIRGSGRVVYSEPEVGSQVAEGSRVVLILEPQS